jgi:hypothetical protein
MAEEWLLVYRAENATEAGLIKSRLEGSGIPVMEKGETVGVVYGFTVGPLAAVELLVPASFYQEALDLLTLQEEEGE